MTSYAYQCVGCGQRYESTEFSPIGGYLNRHCSVCGDRLQRQASTAAFHRGIGEHFNVAVGRHVRNEAHFRSELTRASDAMSERLGVDCNYQPTDIRDAPHTDEGLDVGDKVRRDAGITTASKTIII